MTISRSRLVDTTVSLWYHCVSRCVRKAHLLGSDATTPGRKDWIEKRLVELDQIFAVSVGGFSLMDNHLHLLLRIDPEIAKGWSDSEVVERWFKLFPPRGSDRKPKKVSNELIDARIANVSWIAETRKRLASLGWFMKCLKEPLARLANKQDGCTGAFFEGRFKSIVITHRSKLEWIMSNRSVERRTCKLRSLAVWLRYESAVGLRMTTTNGSCLRPGWVNV
jgi:hypothetical protein